MLVLLGLGGNEGAVAETLGEAVAALSQHVRICATSQLWQSAAVGPPQPDYLNAALLIETPGPLGELLSQCQQIEAATGRDRTAERRWGPRPLDLDLLIAPGVVVQSEQLILPHPRLAERRFALLPACELVPGWIHPRLGRTLAELRAALDPAAQPCHAAGPIPGW